MKPRTTHRNYDQLQAYIAEESELYAEGILDIQAGTIKPDRILPFKRSLFDGLLHTALAKYSLGHPVNELSGDILRALEFLPEVWPDDGKTARPDFLHDCYSQMIWLLTLAEALRLPDPSFEVIVKTWDLTERKDWLIDYLIQHRHKDRRLSQDLLFPATYATLKSSALHSDKELAKQLIKQYLEKEFYPRHKACYWHDLHKSTHNVCFGYWSLEAAAVVSYAKIPSASFADHQYFPSDLFPPQ
jgi:hypothetical protein